MKNISLDELLKRADSRYSLVVATARRAREITDLNLLKDETAGKKAVTKALEEIVCNKIRIKI
ncbi:MAG: DNA-directed RNA polymerase subunit omega [Desulfotomaculum sp.]|nr:DNA-directed RNA polymerase subunit omega [Desulfotomaculum sp.]